MTDRIGEAINTYWKVVVALVAVFLAYADLKVDIARMRDFMQVTQTNRYTDKDAQRDQQRIWDAIRRLENNR